MYRYSERKRESRVPSDLAEGAGTNHEQKKNRSAPHSFIPSLDSTHTRHTRNVTAKRRSKMRVCKYAEQQRKTKGHRWRSIGIFAK